MSHNDHTVPPVGHESIPPATLGAGPAVPTNVARCVRDLVNPLAQVSLFTPDSAGTTLDLHEGQVGILPFRPGLTANSRAWSAHLDWAGLILYPATTTPIEYPITEERLSADAAEARVYLFPARIFTEQSWREGNTFQHIDYLNDDQPGVFWINLDDAPARGDLAPFEITNSSITNRS